MQSCLAKMPFFSEKKMVSNGKTVYIYIYIHI
jgi:hypothetical protein